MMLLSQSDSALPQILMVGGVVLVIAMVLINMRRRMARRDGAALHPYEKIERVKQTHGMQNDLREMMVELEDLTRRFSAQLDAKSRRLERLLGEADRRIAQLNRLTEAAPRHRQHQPRPDADTDPPDPLALKIYEHADAGKTPIQIAGELNEHVGKIELILALRQQ